MEKLIVRNSIEINAGKTKVWDILVNPEQTKKYMFGCATVSNWQIGSSLLWNAFYKGKETTFIKGIIININPERLVKYTVIDPSTAMADIPENYLNVTYELFEENGQTKLTVSQDGFEDAENGQKRYQKVNNNGEGWNSILKQIKKLVETV